MGAPPAAAVVGPFEIRGPLGSGGMGVVYRAYDARLGREVALKVLREGSARDLYRFKREFRAIAGLAHPNLITLHELHTGNDEWFFTMELVDGVSFIDRVRPPVDPVAGARGRRSVLAGTLDEGRLRDALPQLVDGVLALHVSGKLHRDLKPSTVLVTADGRAVILDFGLVSVATAIGMINPAHGMLVQCHHLRAALDAGEPRRACSALAIERGYLGQRGAPAARRALALSSPVARRHARALARERAPWATACALQLQATLAAIAGDRSAAAQLLDGAERAYAAADMRLFATAIRLRKGELDGGSHGASLAAGARDALRDGGIADPDAMARLLCPFPPRR